MYSVLKLFAKIHGNEWWIQGFPDGGAPTRKMEATIYYLAICWKLKEIGRGGGGVLVPPWIQQIEVVQECIPVGCVPSTAVAVWGWGCPGEGVCVSGGVSLPPTEFLTRTCENITFPQLLLRTVIIVSRTGVRKFIISIQTDWDIPHKLKLMKTFTAEPTGIKQDSNYITGKTQTLAN